ncbi:hypothetical protein [Wolbachia pipientis]|uniref:hypothetical protein n=1 Tax=Wolbachia pipientis TaxID=955 RepID=UPI0011D101C6|nr:hypothetical protein [Wolbachia pipientis]
MNFKFLIFFLIFGISHYGYSNCNARIQAATKAESLASKTGKGIAKIFTFDWRDIDFDEKLLQFLKVRTVSNNEFFNPQIEVCDYTGDNCARLYSGTLCHKVYGTQTTGAGVSAKVFIDWDRISITDKIDGLEWEWAEGVTDEAKEKFASFPKICACSQKTACAGYIFASDTTQQSCDTCTWGSNGQQKIKCVPIPRTPTPPPFCQYLSSVTEQIKIIPVADEENDYFLPRVAVKVNNERKMLDIEKNQNKTLSFRGTTYHFKTDKRDGQICAAYWGKGEKRSQLQFPERCFPAPNAPEPEIDRVTSGNSLRIKVKMSKDACGRFVRNDTYREGYCIIDIDSYRTQKIGDFSLKVVKPKIEQKTIDDILMSKVLSKQNKFRILKDNDCIPSVIQSAEDIISVEYQNNKEAKELNRAKMLCISGWQPDPDEFILIDLNDDNIVPLRLKGARYDKYVAIYSQESNKLFYEKLEYNGRLLQDKKDKLNDILFDNEGNIFFAEERKTDSGTCSVASDAEAEDKKRKVTTQCIVYKLVNSEQYINKDTYEEYNISKYLHDNAKMDKHDYAMDGYRRYIRKDNDKPFYMPIKVDRAEVFYADKLCTFDLESLQQDIQGRIRQRLQDKKREMEKDNIRSGLHEYEALDLSQYEFVDIEAWGGGEDGNLAENRLGMPGDYVKARLSINRDYPFITMEMIKAVENIESGTLESVGSAHSIIIKMCQDREAKVCKPLIKVAGGKRSGEDKTTIYEPSLPLQVDIVTGDKVNSSEDNKIAYIEDGQIKYGGVRSCGFNNKSIKYGAGGCINKHNKSYSKGCSGGVVIKPILHEITEDEIKNLINSIVSGRDGDIAIANSNPVKIFGIGLIKQIVNEAIKRDLSCN